MQQVQLFNTAVVLKFNFNISLNIYEFKIFKILKLLFKFENFYFDLWIKKKI